MSDASPRKRVVSVGQASERNEALDISPVRGRPTSGQIGFAEHVRRLCTPTGFLGGGSGAIWKLLDDLEEGRISGVGWPVAGGQRKKIDTIEWPEPHGLFAQLLNELGYNIDAKGRPAYSEVVLKLPTAVESEMRDCGKAKARPGRRSIPDEPLLERMHDMIVSKKAPSWNAAATQIADEAEVVRAESTITRLARKASKKYGSVSSLVSDGK